jgi:hypothetical protein
VVDFPKRFMIEPGWPGRPEGILLLALGACASGPAFTGGEMAGLHAFQDAVREVQRCTDAELFTERLLFELADGLSLYELDLQGRTGLGHARDLGGVVVCFDGALTLIPWRHGVHHPRNLHGEFAHYYTHAEDGTEFIACGGRALRGFDEVLRYAKDGRDGMVIAGVRHGAACLVAGDRVEDRSLFVPRYAPRFSRDGSRVAYERWHLLGSRPVWAPTADPHHCEPLTFPGLIAWPAALSDDGNRWAAATQDGHEWCAVENGEVLARFDELHPPWFSTEGRTFVWKGRVGGKQRVLVGRTLSDPFDEVSGPEFTPGGSWHLLGHDAEGTHLVVDGKCVADQQQQANVVRAARGDGWAWALRGPDGFRVVHGDRSYGPYVADSMYPRISPDGSTVVFRIGWPQPWLVDGERIGEDFERCEDMQPLDGGGCVYTGLRRSGDRYEHWVVAPSGRYGPWDGTGGRKLSADGTRLAFVAWRDREVWRKVVPVR